MNAVFSYLELCEIGESVAQDYAVLFHNLPCCNSQSERMAQLWMPNRTAGEESLSGHCTAFVN